MDKTGIYILYFDDPEKCYIGQSIRINERYRKHKEQLARGTHPNSKLQNAYIKLDKYPCLEILEECNSNDLDKLEIFYISEFDSINSGYNITNGGSVGRGVSSSKSIYTREEILKVFFSLADPTLTQIDIATKYGLPLTLVQTIASDKRHNWTSEEFPEVRQQIKEVISSGIRHTLCNDSNARKGIIYNVIDPNGVSYTFSNIKRFAEEHNLNRSHLNQLVLGKEMQHKGWRKGVPDV